MLATNESMVSKVKPELMNDFINILNKEIFNVIQLIEDQLKLSGWKLDKDFRIEEKIKFLEEKFSSKEFTAKYTNLEKNEDQ